MYSIEGNLLRSDDDFEDGVGVGGIYESIGADHETQ